MGVRFSSKTKEAIAGYIFAAPIIISIMLFTIYPVFAGLYYSFTNYQPTEAQKFKMRFIPEEAMMFHTSVFPDEEDVSYEEVAEFFNPVDFVLYDVGVNLNERQIEAVKNYLDSERLIKDFLAGKLKEEMTVAEFMERYMKAESNLFKRYIPDFIGLSNFKKMAKDQYFWISLKNAFVYSIIVVPVQTLLAILLAVAANMNIRGRGFFKAVFFIPAISSSAAISMIFWLIYSKPGVLNRLLGYLGMQPIDWLNNPNTALGAIMVLNVWTTAGYFMITFLAGLQGIPRTIYEAAEIDGAKFWTRFWKITFPLLRPQILFVSIMGIIGCMQVFDQIYFLIKNMRNITISYYIYKNAFEYHNMGYASAIAMVLFLIILFITTLQRKFMKEEAYF
ncbi:carbohydrate ABC transporter permease [Kosmotoga pacifica]|uniref:ABC transporter permease n=1 Tax=Kosmotoga pacifica TaxID=1330330 RepID=A0A0G2Z9L4_9BACT|nr:sugar ABC transporter permease [Kosmotoga pacifica]AKI98310.1 ABC transporter permease [Kosmotoga pacifica]